QEMADQIVGMEPLHHDHDGVLYFVVESTEEGVAEPLDAIIAGHFRPRILRLYGVVNDNEITAAARERAAGRSRQTAASARGRELELGILCRADPGVRKQAGIQS